MKRAYKGILNNTNILWLKENMLLFFQSLVFRLVRSGVLICALSFCEKTCLTQTWIPLMSKWSVVDCAFFCLWNKRYLRGDASLEDLCTQSLWLDSLSPSSCWRWRVISFIEVCSDIYLNRCIMQMRHSADLLISRLKRWFWWCIQGEM